MSRLAVVITDFNGFLRTRQCLVALFEAGLSLDVIVVDHGTSVDTREALATEFPGITRLEASPDLWWAGATNRGVALALERGATAVMLLNNDCYFAAGSLVELLAQHAAHPEAIVAPVQRDLGSGEVLVITLRSLPLLGFPTLRGSCALGEGLRERGVVPTPLIPGGRGAIIPAAVLGAVGLLDEQLLPHYYADHDFYLRARARGVPLLIATRACVLVDDATTTIAANPGRLDFAGFRETLHSRRSHHNIDDVTVLFRRHLALPGLAGMGVFLYTARYFLLWLLRRARFICGRRH